MSHELFTYAFSKRRRDQPLEFIKDSSLDRAKVESTVSLEIASTNLADLESATCGMLSAMAGDWAVQCA